MTAWVIALILVAVALPLLLARRQRLRRFSVRDRTPEHDAKVTALTEWLGVWKVRVAIQEFEGASFEAIDGIRDICGKMDEESLNNVLHERILKFREVRRAIAGHIARTHKVSRFEAMRALLEWAGKKEAA